MKANPSINRSFADPELDRIDHALGRRFDPLGETSRNYFVTDAGSRLAQEMRASPFWREARSLDAGSAVFSVTDAGREYLADHLQRMPGALRAYDVGVRFDFKDYSSRVIAASASAAKMTHYIDFSDAIEINFRDFLKLVTGVRLADPSSRRKPGPKPRPRLDEVSPQENVAPAEKPIYPMAPRTTWYGEANFAQNEGELVMMPPALYAASVRPLEVDEISEENIQDLVDHVKNGGVLDPLVIFESGKEDGRHRAQAALRLGIEALPVILYGSQRERFADLPRLSLEEHQDAFDMA